MLDHSFATRDVRALALEKIRKLSPELQAMLAFQDDRPALGVPSSGAPVSQFLLATLLHCNGGRAVEAATELKKICDNGGRLFVTMAGAGSSFQMGKLLSELIRQGKVAGISVTGANLEESLYRLLAHSAYVHIRDYRKLTREQELELDHAGFRRITDTFLPEEESVRVVLDHLIALWREAAEQKKSYHWHEFFFQLFERNLIVIDERASLDDCWLYWAWKCGVKVVVPGWEDSTMGNIFTWASSPCEHPNLRRFELNGGSVPLSVVRHNVEYMHDLAPWYLDTATVTPLAFLQLGGGIAADFPICAVPHLKKDYFGEKDLEFQEANVPPWAAFVEIILTFMEAGSYSGAGGDEKITWGKVTPDTYTAQIIADYTMAFPLIAAIILGY